MDCCGGRGRLDRDAAMELADAGAVRQRADHRLLAGGGIDTSVQDSFQWRPRSVAETSPLGSHEHGGARTAAPSVQGALGRSLARSVRHYSRRRGQRIIWNSYMKDSAMSAAIKRAGLV